MSKEISFYENGEVNLNNIVGYDIAMYIQVKDFNSALDLLHIALYNYIDELFEDSKRHKDLMDFYERSLKLSIFYNARVQIAKPKNEFIIVTNQV